MNLLIIGGSGHVSGTLARVALNNGHNVWTVTRGKAPLIEGVNSLIADRHDLDAMERVITGENMSWDLVVDCICFDVPEIRQDIDLFKTRAAHFVLVSTDFVYDPTRRKFPQPEEADLYVQEGEGSLDYGKKKRLCELELIQSDTGDMKWTVVRPCHIYGPSSELGCLPPDGRDADLIAKLRAGKPVRLVGGGHFLQQPILAEDLAATILSAAVTPDAAGSIFNTAGPDIVESWQYYQIVADILDAPLTVEDVPAKDYLAEHPGETPYLCHRIYDLQRLKAAGLTAPSTPIEDGLRLHVKGLLARAGKSA